MTTQQSKSKYKNISLISKENPLFKIYISQYKKTRDKDTVYNKPVQRKSETMGYLLESTINHWVNKTKFNLEEKVICYEFANEKRRKVLLKELDYITKNGQNICVGEVKVSSTENGNLPTAVKQLIYSKELLSEIFPKITLQIIRIELNFNNVNETFDEFTNDFRKVKFRDTEINGCKFQILYLSAKDVFKYGVENKIINSPEILPALEYEMSLIHKLRITKKALKGEIKLLSEAPNVEAKTKIKQYIDKINHDLLITTILVNLSEQGWALVNNKDKSEIIEIINTLGKAKKVEDQTINYCTRTNGFCTHNSLAKYLVICEIKSEIEIKLLDAERVFLRIPSIEGNELQKIKFDLKINSENKTEIHPLYTKFPTRKFLYLNNFINENDLKNKALIHFEAVVKKSQPISIPLKTQDLLIIDNHRILHQRTSSTDGLTSQYILS